MPRARMDSVPQQTFEEEKKLDIPAQKQRIEFALDTPEAREQALKMQITELFLGPSTEKRLIKQKAELAELRQQHIVSEALKAREMSFKEELLVVEGNKAILEYALKDIHDEAVLREVFLDLSIYLDHLRDLTRKRSFVGKSDKPELRSEIAKDVFATFVVHGFKTPEIAKVSDVQGHDIQDPIDQLIAEGDEGARTWYHEERKKNGKEPALFAHTEAVRHFFFKKFPNAKPWMIEQIASSSPRYADGFSFADYSKEYNSVFRGLTQMTEAHEYPGFSEEFPSVENLMMRAYAGESGVMSIRRTFQASVAFLRKSGLSDPFLSELGKIGWKIKGEGVISEPETKTEEIKRREIASKKMRKQFLDAMTREEGLFDARGKDGETIVFTPEQAMRVLPSQIEAVRNAEQKIHELEVAAESTKVAAEQQVKEAAVREAALQTKLKEVADERERDNEEIARLLAELKKTNGQANVLGRRVNEARNAHTTLLGELDETLTTSPGLFGGKLKAALVKILAKARE